MSEHVLASCTRCGGHIPANPANGQFWRLTSFWKMERSQDFFYCSVDCMRRAAIQGLVKEATDDDPDRA